MMHSLRKVTLNEGLQNIGKCSFSSCSLLENITLPSTSTVIEIAPWSFTGSRKLREVFMHYDGIQKIGYNAFGGCDMLESFKSSKK